jgi:hypothetical protein
MLNLLNSRIYVIFIRQVDCYVIIPSLVEAGNDYLYEADKRLLMLSSELKNLSNTLVGYTTYAKST